MNINIIGVNFSPFIRSLLCSHKFTQIPFSACFAWKDTGTEVVIAIALPPHWVGNRH